MKTKVRKWVKYLSSGIFFIALVLNIKISLDDPFILMSEAVVAQTTTTTTTSSTTTTTTSTQTSLKWAQKYCKNLVDHYEICENNGTGNPCQTLGQRTRQCPYPGD